MAYIPNSNSVVAFQSDATKLNATAFQQAGSVLAVSGSFSGGNSSVQIVGQTPPASVSGVGTFNVNPVGNGSVIATLINSSVTALQGTNPWTTQPTSGSVFAYQAPGSIMAVSATVNTGNSSVQLVGGTAMVGSVAAYQGATAPWRVELTSGSVITTGGNSSVTLQPSNNVIGSVAVLQGTNPWVIGNSSVQVNNIVTGNSSVYLIPGVGVLGSVATLQGTNPWIVQLTSGSVITTGGNSSVQVVGLMPPQSVSGVGLFNVNHTGNGSIQALSIGSVGAAQVGVWNTSVWGNVSVLGTVPVTQSGTWATSMVGVAPPHSVVAYQGVANWSIGNSSVQVQNIATGQASVYLIPGVGVLGSVATLQGTNPWIVVTPGSIVTVSKDSSVLAGLYSTNASIVGTYSEDAAHATNDKGFFTLAVRNDTMSSITSADGDYSPQIVGPTGEVITANSPITKWFSNTASVMYGTSVQVVAPPGASIFSYITGIHVMNESANGSRVTITQGLGAVAASILTRVSAPPSFGGSNSNYANGIRVLDNNGISASISGVSSVLITITGFNAKV